MSRPTKLPDSGRRARYATGAIREALSIDKGRFDLLPPEALRRVAVHFARGAVKYSDRNWEKGMKLSRFPDSAVRHIYSFLAGDRSEDHLAAAVWNCLCLIETEHRVRTGRLPAELDDLPPALEQPMSRIEEQRRKRARTNRAKARRRKKLAARQAAMESRS